jgi:hypothetical protein
MSDNEPIEPTCPPTYHLDKTICKCVKDESPIPPIQCPEHYHYDVSLGKCIPDLEPSITSPVEPPVEPPVPSVEFDENGVQMLHKTTGQFVDQEVGGDPAGNGQRYSVNHKYQDYMLIGYFKTGPNQELIEHKTDGPNHGSCTKLPRCCWTEPAIELDTGKSHISSEWPHPKNHDPADAPSAVSLNQNLKNKWIGYAVVAYQSGEFRTIEQWCDPTGLDAEGKPNNNWQLVLKETDTGQVTNPELAKRKLPMDGRGLESEIRMHGDTGKHGTTTDMKFCRVYEIVNPSSEPSQPPEPQPPQPQPPEPQPPIEPEPPVPTEPTGAVLWDSNVHLKTGQSFTVTDEHGPQTPDSKGLWMAASGKPRLIVDPDGTYHLEADAGHGRVYIRALNFNARLESDFMFEDSNIENSTWRLSCRHNEGGACENRFGGIGFTIERDNVGHKTEPCHNIHENSIDKPLSTKINDKQWIRVRCDCKRTPDNKKILILMAIDYKDGKGFQTVLEGEHPSPKPYYMDEPTFMKESYIWLRVNNAKTGRVAFKNTLLTKL